MMALSGMIVWEVTILNNYYIGPNVVFSGRRYPVIAKSAEEAKQTVIFHAAAILEDLTTKKLVSGKSLIPSKSALLIDNEMITAITPGTAVLKRTNPGFRQMFSLTNRYYVKLTNGNIVDVQ